MSDLLLRLSLLANTILDVDKEARSYWLAVAALLSAAGVAIVAVFAVAVWSSAPFSGFIKYYHASGTGPCFARLNWTGWPANGSTTFQNWTDPTSHTGPPAC